MFDKRRLECGIAYGRKAKDVYALCCEWFGWEKGLAGKFGMMQPLFADGAADKGSKAVWFICYSNRNGKKLVSDVETGKMKHKNFIYPDLQRIDEYYMNAPFDTIYPLQDRITFAKNKKGDYVFLGVYRAKNPTSKARDREFYRVSSTYPER